MAAAIRCRCALRVRAIAAFCCGRPLSSGPLRFGVVLSVTCGAIVTRILEVNSPLGSSLRAKGVGALSRLAPSARGCRRPVSSAWRHLRPQVTAGRGSGFPIVPRWRGCTGRRPWRPVRAIVVLLRIGSQRALSRGLPGKASSVGREAMQLFRLLAAGRDLGLVCAPCRRGGCERWPRGPKHISYRSRQGDSTGSVGALRHCGVERWPPRPFSTFADLDPATPRPRSLPTPTPPRRPVGLAVEAPRRPAPGFARRPRPFQPGLLRVAD